MANRFFNPNEQFCDATGAPYAGGSLAFYASGTTTPLNTYSDKALSIANTNPVVLDSAGRAGSVFLQNLAYKVVLSDVGNNVVWTFDPVYASDYSTTAQVLSIAGSPNGALAGTAGSATIPASMAWDFINNILYVCTQTGTIVTAAWTAINAGSASAVVPTPQGYLTPVSATPIIAADSTAATTVYYTPYVGNLVPIYNGTSFTPTTFTEISCALVAAHTASNIYDFFIFNNSGVLTLVTGPAWSAAGAGAGARGTGAGSTQLSRINGLWVNSVSMTARNGSTTYTVPANQGTYVGSMYVDATNGQVSCHRSYGQSRKWGIWNAYNRAPIQLQGGDATASWNYNTATIRAANGNSANSITVFCGLPEEQITIAETQLVQIASSNAASGNFNLSGTAEILIGINSTTTSNSLAGELQDAWGLTLASGTFSSVSSTRTATVRAETAIQPAIGINVVYALETSSISGTGTITVTYLGTAGDMILRAQYRG